MYVDRSDAISSTLEFVSAEMGDCGLPVGRTTDRPARLRWEPVCYTYESDPVVRIVVLRLFATLLDKRGALLQRTLGGRSA
jgi:hypothetical protein